ncbi:MAG TPA: GlsB/YeaQ/YmgE family stress response membrane protein [Paludibaculum sp.]|jgi:uncharacterized membrane protein YeaQ/YmgE (transglycosylase-associated protein family)
MFWLIKTAIVGLIVGSIAKWVMPGKDPGGFWITMALGIAGSFVGTMIGQFAGLYDDSQAAGWIVSTIGAVLLLWVYRKFNQPSA